MSEEKKNEEFEKGRLVAISLAAVVYIGVIVLATGLFISFVLLAFPKDAYFSRFIMTIGCIMVGLSMVAFPVALEYWTVTKSHRKTTVIAYYIEFGIIAVNTFVSFWVLMAANNEWIVPPWLLMYEPFTIVSIVYTIVAWGTIFQQDPRHKSKAKLQELRERRNDLIVKREMKIADKLEEFFDSVDGEDAIIEEAREMLPELMRTDRINKKPTRFGSRRLTPSMSADVKKENLDESKN